MPVFRVERNKGYTVMSNYHLRDKSLSLKAKGLLPQILSLPEDWGLGLCPVRPVLYQPGEQGRYSFRRQRIGAGRVYRTPPDRGRGRQVQQQRVNHPRTAYFFAAVVG